MELYGHQIKALKKMHNGCCLCGETGSGKSLTALAYYHLSCGGTLKIDGKGRFGRMKKPRPLYIITTPKKRDDGDWVMECTKIACGEDVIVDSWNNIKKYRNITGAFFIFDEQRVSGKGVWAKTFIRIARRNQWILLSATPGDDWEDYIPLFVANNFYMSRSEMLAKHAIYAPFRNFPQIIGWVDKEVLEGYRDRVLVPMPMAKSTVPNHIDIYCSWDKVKYKTIWRDRWDPYENKPIKETGKLFYLIRRCTNESQDRIDKCKELILRHPRVIIFYNFVFELDILMGLRKELFGYRFAQWNGDKHQPIPKSKKWVYLVQYNSGAEGWNCVETDTLIFYSQSYSYKQMIQAAGRIDRLNTKYKILYYYHLLSKSPIDKGIRRALENKKNFNEKAFLGQKK